MQIIAEFLYVLDFAIPAGGSATIIKYRFSQEAINKIKEQAWWNKEIDELNKGPGVFFELFRRFWR